MPAPLSPQILAEGVLRSDRALLARAISLIESSHPAHAADARRLLRLVLPHAGRSIRLGITGVPGAGKSTFIDRFGATLIREHRRRVAVLAVDPSSTRTGGSILGDKTRMSRLASLPEAFIRPSPSAGALGGVAAKTREAILLVEAAGYDTVLVETVGVGQSETAVANMTDVFIAVLIAGAGDSLQGIKRGLLELVDVVLLNKADGENRPRALHAAREIAAALRILAHPGHDPEGRPPPVVIPCSAATGDGLPEVWHAARSALDAAESSGRLRERRRAQDVAWLHELIADHLRNLARRVPTLARAEQAVRDGAATPTEAAAWIAAELRPVPLPSALDRA